MRALFLSVSAVFIVFQSHSQNFVRYLNKYDMEISKPQKTEFEYFELVQGQGSVVLIHRFQRDSVKVFEKTVFFDSVGNQLAMNKREFYASKKLKSMERVDYLLDESQKKTFYETGPLRSEVMRREGEAFFEKYYDLQGAEVPKFEQSPPIPKGDMLGWNQYLSTTLQYPLEARRAGHEGMVIVVFTLDKEGVISDPQVFNKGENHQSLEREALRIFEEYPYRWVPAMEEGVPVETVVRLPIRFKLG